MGEESCSGCMRVIYSYRCSRCGGEVPNPSYRSGIECHSCGAQVVPTMHRTEKYFIKAYFCPECEEIVHNPYYKGDHSCAGCRPQKCEEVVDGEVCGGFLAFSPKLQFKKCIICSHIIELEKLPES